jgi:hypothetical protein
MSGLGEGKGAPIRRIKTRSNAEVPALGLGMYRTGEDRTERAKAFEKPYVLGNARR